MRGSAKAAILMLTLSGDVASQIIRFLGEDEVAAITAEMAMIGTVPSQQREAVLDEFTRAALHGAGGGGLGYVRELLERALGAQRARDMMERLAEPQRAAPFERMRRAPADQIAALLQDEHPQVAAVALTRLRSDQAAQVLRYLPDDRKADVARRIARAQPVDPELMRRVEHALERRLTVVPAGSDAAAGGVRVLVDIITRVDRETERAVLAQIEQADPALAEEVKGLLFVFEDLMMLGDSALQRVLRDVEHKVVATALKGASDDLREMILKNLSTRAVEIVKEEMDLMGAVRVRDVEDARRIIVGTVRQLEEAGEITVMRGEEQLVS
jgi:flagellar motor switch protein FliG